MAKKEVFGTKEWAAENADDCRGCLHNCWYCYASANNARFKIRSISERDKLEFYDDKILKLLKKAPTTVMYPTQHDIHLDTINISIITIARLIIARHKVLIVSKPRLECIDKICHVFKGSGEDKIKFRFSIGSPNDETLKFWEPNAPDLADRTASLKTAFRHGYETSVSCEPLLTANIEEIKEMVNTSSPYVTDSIWIGKPNMLKSRLTLNQAPADVKAEGNRLMLALSDVRIMEIYEALKDNPIIKWKDSIKKIVGIERPTTAGKDI